MLKNKETTATHACFQEVSGLIKTMKYWEEQNMVITANTQTPFSLNYGMKTQMTTDQWVRVLILYSMAILLSDNSGKVWMTALVLPRHMKTLKTVIQTLLLLMVSQCSILTVYNKSSILQNKSKLHLTISIAKPLGIAMTSLKEFHRMPLKLKKLKRDSNGHTIGKSNLNLLKDLGAS